MIVQNFNGQAHPLFARLWHTLSSIVKMLSWHPPKNFLESQNIAENIKCQTLSERVYSISAAN